MNVNWEGIYPAITTQFHKDGSLDLDLFEKNLRFQIDAGIHGVIVGGSLGEASTLQPEEKLHLVKKTLKVTDGSIPVILNIAEQSTRRAVFMAEEAEKIGASGLMMLPPLNYKSTDSETVAYFKTVALSTSLPILVYNNPVDYKIGVTPEMFEQLIRLENIQAVKDSTRDVSNVTRLINRFGKRIKILCGVDTLALEYLCMGADGWVGGLVNAFPEETLAVFELFKNGRLDEARTLYRWFLPLLELDISPQLVQNIKMAEAAMGIGSEYVRPPRMPLEGEERSRVQRIIDTSLKNKPVIPALS